MKKIEKLNWKNEIDTKINLFIYFFFRIFWLIQSRIVFIINFVYNEFKVVSKYRSNIIIFYQINIFTST